MSRELIRELRYVADWAQHHLDKAKIVNDGADALEAQASRIAELGKVVAALKGDLTQRTTDLMLVTEERDTLQAQIASMPDTCDGKEQEAFEAWAVSQKFDMQTHPRHYLFLDIMTNATRQAWKAAILYCRKQVDAAKPMVRELSDADITAIAKKECSEGRLLWAGFDKDEDGRYTVPILSPSHFQLVHAVLAVARSAT